MANVNYQDGGRVGFVLKGEYDATATYEHLDVVSLNGISYMCRLDNTTGVAPTPGSVTTHWQPITDRGGHRIFVQGSSAYNNYGPSAAGEISDLGLIFSRANFQQISKTDATTGATFNCRVIIPDVSISADDWTAIQAILNPSTT